MVLGIYGAGGSGRDLYTLILQEGKDRNWDEVVFIDDTKPDGSLLEARRIPFEEFCGEFPPENARIIIAVGEPAHREMLYERVRGLGYELYTYIHDSARIGKSAQVGEGTAILDDVYVGPLDRIGANVWINGYTIIGHDVVLGDHCQVSSQVIVAGNTVVEDCVYIGAGASVRERINVGKYAVISMGAVVLKPVRPEAVVMGNPARQIALNEDHRVFE